MSSDCIVPVQQWQDREYCREYATTWEISTSEVHYGWLAPGENSLRLLAGFELQGARVLDIGCGMGENLMSLSKKGAICYGIDISEHMLRYARVRSSKIVFVKEDMRRFSCFPKILFDVILSVYSLEYLESLKEFREVLANLYHRLRPGGTFIFCFSHPLQHYRHSMLRNESAMSSPSDRSPIIYSFRDVVQCLDETGFTIDRVVEQETTNPSSISYEDGLRFPYHFHHGRNPCAPAMDAYSNAAPHTVIYKVKKPDGGILLQRQMSLVMEFGKVRIWGEFRRIRDSVTVDVAARKFQILKLEPRDAVVGLCSISSFVVQQIDLQTKPSIRVSVQNEKPKRQIPRNSLLGIVSRRLQRKPLQATFQQDWIVVPEHHRLINSVFVSRVDPLFAEFINVFPKEQIGVLVFVNGEEPGSGKVGLENFFPVVGDRVDVVYIACDRVKAAAGEFLKSDRQLDLFSFPLFETLSVSEHRDI